MSKRLYGGKTLDELKCYAVGAKQWRGKSFDIRVGLIDRIYELEKALQEIENIHHRYIALRKSPEEISEREQVLREWEEKIETIARKALRGER